MVGGVTEGKYCRGETGGGLVGPAGVEPDGAGDGSGRPGGTASGGVATGTCVNVSPPGKGNPPESVTDGSSGASFETQNRPWQRGQFA